MTQTNDRIRAAVESLREGKPFKVDELWLGMERKKTILVSGSSKRASTDKLSEVDASRELADIKGSFAAMVEYSTELGQFIMNKEIKYVLYIPAAQSEHVICSESNGIIDWNVKLKAA